jgi:putative GTP pyrophosphokinase
MAHEVNLEEIMAVIEQELHDIDLFRNYVARFFETHPDLTRPPPVVHSIRSRLKDMQHLREKIQRKSTPEEPITPENVFERITDIAGVRVLHLYQAQFSQIHRAITRKIESRDWFLHENPTAYTWDPESKAFFDGHGLNVEVKESLYTSIHYVVKSRPDFPLCCEIQVRTLFEEIWGEIDHTLNYPNPTDNISCREQIGVLARLVGAGSRLADAIFRTYTEAMQTNETENY